MDGADPEKRIAELERQLAEARAAGDGADRGALTPDQVRDTAFAKPPLGRRGYNEVEVDAFLDRVEAALRDPAAHTHLLQSRSATWPFPSHDLGDAVTTKSRLMRFSTALRRRWPGRRSRTLSGCTPTRSRPHRRNRSAVG